ncbi:S1/P1 nuclease [Nevskia sp.]|uniref:S1/P1 nuclease n=1 Tax=Nevskia sp. TaxID=1929292 RepID=UPI0025E0332B|nr:S1/P1 nuclease [Nevskia sp.]
MTIRAALHRFIVGAVLIASIPQAQAWGREGHRIVGQIAADHLTPAATTAVAVILAGEPEATLAGVSSWADDIRSRETGPLHYVNFPRGTCAYVPARDCKNGRCVIGGIEQSIATLRYTGATAAAKNEALKNLVHFAGDIHQPLHAGLGEDRGGNLVQLQWAGEGTNLHSVWDSQMIRSLDPDWTRHVARLSPAAATLPLTTLDSADWALESCTIAFSDGFYPSSAKLDEATYLRRWQPTIDQRLSLAGMRLAALLNALFP